MSKRHRTGPDPDWVPLRRAVFALHAQEVGRGANTASLDELAEILATESGAQTSISAIESSFSLYYPNLHCGIDGPPWAILGEVAGLSELAMTSSTAGWGAAPYEIMRRATEFVWRELMLPAFNRAVSTEVAVVHARPEAKSPKFEQLHPSLWSALTVVDWPNGVAVDSNGSRYWSIHVRFSSPTGSLTQPLRQAPRSIIHEAIRVAYDDAEASGTKPPNIKQLPSVVQPLLQTRGYNASGRSIMLLGGDGQHARRRRPPGRTVRNDRRAPTK